MPMKILCCFTSLAGRNDKIQVVSHETSVEPRVEREEEEEEEVAYEGEDEHENDMNSKVDSLVPIGDIHIQERVEYNNLDLVESPNDNLDIEINNDGHLSDPGVSKKPVLGSPKLKRTCSNLETKRFIIKEKIVPCESFEDLQKLADGCMSPVSMTSNCSADKVMLRKCSSSQILPSKSRRLWWKLFLWSHRNLHEPVKGIHNKLMMINQQGGYSSDTLEPNQRLDKSKSKLRKLENANNGDKRWDSFHQGSAFWPQNQWMAFPTRSPSASSPLTRVDEWVQDIPTEHVFTIGNEDSEITFSPSSDNGRSPARIRDVPEEVAYANRVIQSLNSSSTVAYISGIGLKVIPVISGFTSLRSVNLSGNSIVQITSGSLPKSLHILDLSRNKIGAIGGLRELTRLRILDLSYNRISRIGQGLSNCTLIKELYLAGNKISNVEGLHRLLKLTILDLSFNKITTSKALGQLVANYNSLQALNLLGNPIQNNINDDQLRKTLCGLLPNLAYLNKQPVNPQKAREVAKEAVTKAALGSGNLSARRRAAKRVGSGGSTSFSRHRGSSGSGSSGQKGRHGVKPKAHHRSIK
uniref:uncharacterized protein LOC122578846 isoform X2 n=1 Tax=Erigeron canadensis TaxID=72917 RepID=UPI001CB8AC36|nr:uncharacterized protein LOC122578846 isoform X2 [Erigeron canadensis]